MGPLDILGVASSATREEIKDAFRKLAKERHPDNGGNAEAFRELYVAYKEALKGAREWRASSSEYKLYRIVEAKSERWFAAYNCPLFTISIPRDFARRGCRVHLMLPRSLPGVAQEIVFRVQPFTSDTYTMPLRFHGSKNPTLAVTLNVVRDEW